MNSLDQVLRQLETEMEDISRGIEDLSTDSSADWDELLERYPFGEYISASEFLSELEEGEEDTEEERTEEEEDTETQILPPYYSPYWAPEIGIEKEIEFQPVETAFYTNYVPPVSSYYNVEIRRVPKFKLGYNILGRAFPRRRTIEIRDDLYGHDFEEVKTHELLHIKHPQKSEYEIRQMTRVSVPFNPRWH